jgi:ElaB/YqjD/DUF883 family membrane-anchored ribosome-binding protein
MDLIAATVAISAAIVNVRFQLSTERTMTDSVHEATKIRSATISTRRFPKIKNVLQSVATARGERAEPCAPVEQRLETARQRLRKLEEVAMDATSAAARATDEFVHENPWQTIGVAASLGAALGVVIGMLVSRR